MTEAEIRALVIANIDSRCKVVEEVTIVKGRTTVRVDIATFDDNDLHGIEIKSDADNLKRLPAQLEMYAKVFGTVTIVCSPRWVRKVIDLAPDWMGIVTAHGGLLSLVRYPGTNPGRCLRTMASLLWCNELRAALRQHKLPRGGGKGSLVEREEAR